MESPPSSANRADNFNVISEESPSAFAHAFATTAANASMPPAPDHPASPSVSVPCTCSPHPVSLSGGGGAPHFATTDLANFPLAVVGSLAFTTP